jgi:Ca2+:H+ antiporter
VRWLLIFVPISIVAHYLNVPSAWMFALSSLAIVPLAGLLGAATEDLAKRWGAAVGGLLNATFGNATEMIIALIALQRGELQVVRASLIGSIIGNVLLVLGLSALLGGIKQKILTFNQDVAQSHSVMMALAATALLVPALFVRSVPGLNAATADPRIEHLSLGVAAVLMVLYIGSLIFALYTHESLFRGTEECAEAPEWKQSTALMTLLGATLLIALESEYLVGSIGTVVQQWGLSKLFVGIIIVPIVGNAAEHSTAVMMAMRNKMDISLNIALSSSTQIAMFVAPVCIFASLALGHPLTILFSNFELIALAAAILTAVLITMDGKSHWLEGAQLLAAYGIIGLAFYFVTG